jgi:MerR family transcriptional regulator, thiopeptide resistance regulator
MQDVLDIAEVVRRTGLTSRALRFYEARGLVRPLRTHSGRRLYGPGELERINQVVALKKAGLTLAQIARLTSARPLDLAQLIAAQLDAIDVQARELAEARALLLTVKSRIDQGAPVDAAAFCALIRNGDTIMDQEQWKKVLADHYTPEELAHWAENPPPAGFDQEAYTRQWQELGARIEAALPLDPAGEQAQTFLAEWDALLAPFRAVATPQMMEGATRFWEQADRYRDQVTMPFSREVMRFIQAACEARRG